MAGLFCVFFFFCIPARWCNRREQLSTRKHESESSVYCFSALKTFSRFPAMHPSCRNMVTARDGWEKKKKNHLWLLSPLWSWGENQCAGWSCERHVLVNDLYRLPSNKDSAGILSQALPALLLWKLGPLYQRRNNTRVQNVCVCAIN